MQASSSEKLVLMVVVSEQSLLRRGAPGGWMAAGILTGQYANVGVPINTTTWMNIWWIQEDFIRISTSLKRPRKLENDRNVFPLCCLKGTTVGFCPSENMKFFKRRSSEDGVSMGTSGKAWNIDSVCSRRDIWGRGLEAEKEIFQNTSRESTELGWTTSTCCSSAFTGYTAVSLVLQVSSRMDLCGIGQIIKTGFHLV